MVPARQLLSLVVALASFAAAQSGSEIRVDDWQAYADNNRYGVQYGPGWIQQGFQDPVSSYYRGTYTTTHSTGAYAMLSFRGTGISYNTDKGPDSGIVMLAIDGNELPLLNPNSSIVEHQQAIFSISGLAPGDHQIVIGAQPGYVNSTGVVGLDFFGVTPLDDGSSYVPRNLGPGAWSVPLDAVVVDDTDPMVRYSDDSWKMHDVNLIGPTPLFFNLTQHTSRVPGSLLSFTFRGTGVWYFSDDFQTNADVLISVDGGEGEIVKTSTGVTWVSQRMSWSKTGLLDGEHTVTVTHAGQRGQYANLDFFMYLPSGASAESASHAPDHLGAILGGVMGGLVGLAVVVLALVYFYRRHRLETKNDGQEVKETGAGTHHVTLAKTTTKDSQATLDEKVDMV
ncbi:transmembrane protein [Ceratobasidium sp. AG-Ba]|nr:transmembrane protein [Ceratobasidium sp. AG-Ba]